MTDLAKLQVQLQLQQDQFQKGMQAANKSLDRMEKQSKKSASALGRIEKMAGGLRTKLLALGTAALGAFSVQAFRNAVSYADTLGKTAAKLGVTTDALQQYRFAAEQSGVASNTFDMALQRFARRSGEARNGMGELVKVYQELGISLKDSEGRFKDTETLFNEFAQAISEATDEQEALRLAFKGFDSEGAALVNMLKNGAQGLEDFKNQANGLGVVIDKELIARAEQLENKLGQISMRWNAFKTELFVEAGSSVFDTIINVEEADAAISKVESRIEGLKKTIEDASNTSVFTQMIVGTDAVDVSRLTAELKQLEAELKQLRATRQQFVDEAAAKDPARIAAEQAAAATRAFNEALDEQNAKLQEWAEKLVRTSDPSIQLAEDIEKLNFALEKGYIAEEEYIRGLEHLMGVQKDAKDPAAELAKELEKQAQQLKLAHDPVFAFEQAMIELNAVWETGAISADVYRAAVLDAQRVFEGIETPATRAAEVMREVEQSLIPNFDFIEVYDELVELLNLGAINGQQFGEAVDYYQKKLLDGLPQMEKQKSLMEQTAEQVRFNIDLNKSWGDNLKNIGKEIVATLMEIYLTQKLVAMATKYLGFSSAQAHGGAWNNGVQFFAHGGVVAGPTAFGMAGGKMGIMGEAGPEAIVPLSRGSNGDLGVKMSVNVVNNASNSATVQVEEKGDGQLDIIINAITQDILRGGGKVSGAMERTYGVRR